jgi:hypothetical protein
MAEKLPRKRALALGWRILPLKSGHERWLSPDGKTQVLVSGTPSDHRAMKNALADLRRAGL